MTIRSFVVRVVAPSNITDEDETRMAEELGRRVLEVLEKLHGETPDGYGVTVIEA